MGCAAEVFTRRAGSGERGTRRGEAIAGALSPARAGPADPSLRPPRAGERSLSLRTGRHPLNCAASGVPIPELPPITWTDWPARRQPLRSVAALVVIVAVVVAIVPLDPWLAVVGAVVLVISTSEALLPTPYQRAPGGVKITRPFTRRSAAWGRFRGFAPTEDGFVLLGAGSRPVLRRLRTVQIRCVEGRASVARWLDAQLEGACAP